MSEPRGQTFMLHARPSPLCESEWVKLSPHWLCDDPTKREFVGLLVWLVCVHTHTHKSVQMPSCDMKTSPCWQCAWSAQGRGIRSWTLVAGILFCTWEANCWSILVLLDFLIFVFQISQVLIICIDRTRWDGGITGRESPGWGGSWFRTLVLCRYWRGGNRRHSEGGSVPFFSVAFTMAVSTWRCCADKNCSWEEV